MRSDDRDSWKKCNEEGLRQANVWSRISVLIALREEKRYGGGGGGTSKVATWAWPQSDVAGIS